jgi:hypothetical protein
VFDFTVLRLTGINCIGEQRSQKARLTGFAGECRAFEGSKTSKLKGRSTVDNGKLKGVFEEYHRTAFKLA